MKQSRTMSLLETSLSTGIGLIVALLTQIAVFPLFGFHPRIDQNLAITAIFTVVSIVRQYVVRRLFEAMHIRQPLSPFLTAVIAERQAHLAREGWDDAHDDAHRPGELAQAGAMYALHAGTQSSTPPHEWPWADDWWKPTGFRRDLVKACALVVAEGDRFDRDRKRGRGR